MTPADVSTVLAAQLGQFDDDAWAALANRGLLRRATKDLAVVSLALAGAQDDAVSVTVGEHTVRFDQRGPAHATCTCPSRSTCQHVLCAGLWLAGPGASALTAGPGDRAGEGGGAEDVARGRAGADDRGSPATDPDAAPSTGTVPSDHAPVAASMSALHDALLSWGPDELTALAGVGGYRWARRRLDDLDQEADVRIETGRYVLVTLSQPAVSLRYLGGPPAGIVADRPLRELARHQALAVLAYQRAHGVEHAPAPALAGPRGAERSLAESRERLLPTAARLLTDTVRIGLAHPSKALGERYETTATWAQGAEYHRLARLLRRLADHIGELLDRSVAVDTEAVLDEVAVAHALAVALDRARATGAAPMHLVGRPRSRYDDVPAMELVGVGGVPWRAAAGYHGLTTLFWWPARRRFVSATDARPVTLAGFDPRRRWTQAGPWTGLASPAATAGALVRLTDARLSGGGRLSVVESTRAAVDARTGAQVASLLPAVARWRDIDVPVAGLLAEPDPLAAWAVLAPASWEAAEFDPVAQVLRWPLRDEVGEVLVAEVPWSATTAPLVEAVERLSGTAAAGALLVCRVRRSGSGLVAEPMSVVRTDRAADARPVEALHFGMPAMGGPVADGGGVLTGPAEVGAPGPRSLLDLRAAVLRLAERGTGASVPGVVPRELEAVLARARAAGFDILPRTVEGEPAEALLRVHAVLLQLDAVVGGRSAEDI